MGRLYQSESAANADRRPLKEIADYVANRTLQRVFIKHLRHEQGEPLWFVHERWGRNNPWESLNLREGDILSGAVMRHITASDGGALLAYLIQLEVGTPIEADRPVKPGEEERPQPDIEVFLPVAEIPWSEGSLGDTPEDRRASRLPLEIGDPVQVRVLDIRFPPEAP
jgi:hypothetical protein